MFTEWILLQKEPVKYTSKNWIIPVQPLRANINLIDLASDGTNHSGHHKLKTLRFYPFNLPEQSGRWTASWSSPDWSGASREILPQSSFSMEKNEPPTLVTIIVAQKNEYLSESLVIHPNYLQILRSKVALLDLATGHPRTRIPSLPAGQPHVRAAHPMQNQQQIDQKLHKSNRLRKLGRFEFPDDGSILQRKECTSFESRFGIEPSVLGEGFEALHAEPLEIWDDEDGWTEWCDSKKSMGELANTSRMNQPWI